MRVSGCYKVWHMAHLATICCSLKYLLYSSRPGASHAVMNLRLRNIYYTLDDLELNMQNPIHPDLDNVIPSVSPKSVI